MKKTVAFFVSVAVLALPIQAQKKMLDHSVYDGWQSVSRANITPSGSVMAYEVNPQEGDGQLIIRVLSTGKVITVERGTNAVLSEDGKWAYCLVKPLFKQTYDAKKKGKKGKDLPKDSVAYINLTTGEIGKLPNAEGFKTGRKLMPYVAYQTDIKEKKDAKAKDSNEPPKKDAVDAPDDGGKDGGKDMAKSLVIVNPSTGKADTVKHVSAFLFNESGNTLAIVTKKEKKDSLSKSAVILRFLDKNSQETIAEGLEFYGSPAFSKTGDKLVFLASTDSVKTGNRHCSVQLYADGQLKELLPQGFCKGLPNDWTINENAAPHFSTNGNRLWLGVAPFLHEKDTTVADFEKARLDVWHYADFDLQPTQKLNQKRDQKKVYPAVIDLAEGGSLVALTFKAKERITAVNEGNADWALADDETNYYIQSQWLDNDYRDLYMVSLKDGSRTLIAKQLNASAEVSPEGKYVLWYCYDDAQWYAYNTKSGQTVCLTKSLSVNFYDEDDDHPSARPPFDRHPQWVEGDAAVLINDRYDVWKLQPDGKQAVCLTAGYGRKTNQRFLHDDWNCYDKSMAASSFGPNRGFSIREKQVVKKNEKLMLTVFNYDDMRNGLARVSLTKAAIPEIATVDTFSFTGLAKARNAEVYAYRKGNFRHPMDLYLTKNFFKSSQQLTTINPQQADYRWGTAQLFQWTAYDGTPLKGVVYIPDGVKQGEKLPVMIYFYERYSESLYDYFPPAPSRSTVNRSFYTSRGYIVFVPDIVYKDGHPGQSAYNCIVSGAEALCEKYACADRSRMAIQGQSWGGYQTAYLVTRTNLFKAAGAGAPVSNMTSAYGGIRWGSGVARLKQYEHGQSRIGKSLWDEGGLDLYLENSPLFNADKVETPLLIMHNDADGAVPWYQGIEYFVALRRNGKKVWLLEYNDEAHNLVERRNCKDLSIRLQQFFDHYLKDAPAPQWMKTGVPATMKDRTFGLETE